MLSSAKPESHVLHFPWKLGWNQLTRTTDQALYSALCVYELNPHRTYVGGLILVTHRIKKRGSTKRTTRPITQAGFRSTHSHSLTRMLSYVLFELSLEEAIPTSPSRGAVTSSGKAVAEQQNL